MSPKEATRSTTFTPEFSGQRQSYEIVGTIESQSDHGLVITALYEVLKARGFNAGNDRHRDLFLATRDGTITHLFEAKTELSTTSLYEGVGQLMLLGALRPTEPKRILVLPRRPVALRATLKRIGIRLVTYEWTDSKPMFHGLDEAVEG
jgi:hypothetical protein